MFAPVGAYRRHSLPLTGKCGPKATRVTFQGATSRPRSTATSATPLSPPPLKRCRSLVHALQPLASLLSYEAIYVYSYCVARPSLRGASVVLRHGARCLRWEVTAGRQGCLPCHGRDGVLRHVVPIRRRCVHGQIGSSRGMCLDSILRHGQRGVFWAVLAMRFYWAVHCGPPSNKISPLLAW